MRQAYASPFMHVEPASAWASMEEWHGLRPGDEGAARDQVGMDDELLQGVSAEGKGLFVRVDNFAHLVAAYGKEAGICACATLCGLLCEAGCHVISPVDFMDGCMVASYEEPLSLDDVRRRFAYVSFSLGNAVIHLAITVVETPFVPTDRESVLSLMAAVPDFAGEPVGRGRAWEKRYREDMANTALIIGAIAADRINLSWQPVGYPASEAVFYHECLIRAPNRAGSDWAPEDYLPSIERLGFARVLDDHILTRVLDELEASETVILAANISAHSALLDAWWAPVIKRLQAKPWLASRLVIEITETAALPSISHAISFVEEFHALGCRIALDDFGVGYSSIRQLLSLRPDIVKIDRFFVIRARSTERDAALFQNLVTLASSLAPIVVVEGVETAVDAERAARAGAAWQQGYHLGRPSSVRSWRLGSSQLRSS